MKISNATIKSTERKALITAKRELASQCGVTKLNSKILIKHSSVQCACGESYAVLAWSLKYQKASIVCVCKRCANN